MPPKLQLTLAAGDYDRIGALKDGTVQTDGIELTILTDMTPEVRHARRVRKLSISFAAFAFFGRDVPHGSCSGTATSSLWSMIRRS